jgi:dCMP deaminase
VTLFPCNECAKLIASSKVKEVIYLSDKHHSTETNRIAKKIFELSGVTYRKLDFPSDHLHKLTEHLQNLLTDI